MRGARGTGLTLGDPLAYAEKLYGYGFRVFHIVDLDGAERGAPVEAHLKIARIVAEELGACVQYGGGLRRLSDVEKACGAGATPVIGSAWLSDPEMLDRASEACGRVIAALDYSGGRILYNAWRSKARLGLDEALSALEERRVTGYLLTAVDVEGTLEGPDVEGLARARSLTPRPIEYSGGISSMQDLEAVERAGADAAILGMALASGLLDAREVAARYG